MKKLDFYIFKDKKGRQKISGAQVSQVNPDLIITSSFEHELYGSIC